MPANEFGSLLGTLLGVLEVALSLQHRPGTVAVLRHLREDRAEIHLPVAGRAEPAGRWSAHSAMAMAASDMAFRIPASHQKMRLCDEQSGPTSVRYQSVHRARMLNLGVNFKLRHYPVSALLDGRATRRP